MAASEEGGTHRGTLPLLAAVASLEGYDLACYGVTLPVLLADRSMGADATRAGTVGGVVAVGMMAGAALAGGLVARFGARRLLLLGTGVFSIGMLVCAVMPTIESFAAARLVVGVGLGLVLPSSTAYVAELSGQFSAGRNVGLMMVGTAAGAVAAPLIGAALLPAVSWRWIYLIGAAPAILLLPLAARALPTGSLGPRRPTTAGGPDPADGESPGLAALLAPAIRTVTMLFWLLSFCGLLLVFGISTWLPVIMQGYGASLGSALLLTAALWFGAGAGMVAGGRLVDLLGPKPVVAVSFAIGACCLLSMSLRPPPAMLFVLVLATGAGLIGSQVLVNAFVVTHYPPAHRGPGIGWALSVGRLGAILGPLLGGWVQASRLEAGASFLVFALVALLGTVVALLVPAARPAVRRGLRSGYVTEH